MAVARTLIEAGFNVTVVEADARMGGRVHTDLSIFGVPYDVGAHWLHAGHLNPFVGYGRENGFDVYEAPDEETAAKVSMISLSNGAFQAESWVAIPYRRFVELSETL